MKGTGESDFPPGEGPLKMNGIRPYPSMGAEGQRSGHVYLKKMKNNDLSTFITAIIGRIGSGQSLGQR